jgi:hypothetical protein
MPKLRKTTIYLEVLSPVDDQPEDCGLQALARRCEDDWVGYIAQATSEILEGEAAAEACAVAGSEIAFFDEFGDVCSICKFSGIEVAKVLDNGDCICTDCIGEDQQQEDKDE